MIFQEENQLLQHIKLGHLYRVYLLYGEEKYLKELYLKRLVRLASPEQFEEFNFHRFDGGELEVDRLIEACESLPFLAEQRCVVVEKFDFEGMPAADKEKLTRLLEDPPETTVLILVVDKEDFSAKKSAGAKKLIALCDKAGAVLELKRRSMSDLVRFIRWSRGVAPSPARSARCWPNAASATCSPFRGSWKSSRPICRPSTAQTAPTRLK